MNAGPKRRGANFRATIDAWVDFHSLVDPEFDELADRYPLTSPFFYTDKEITHASRTDEE